LFQAWNSGPYDLSTNKTFTINYSFDAGNTWTALTLSDLGTGALSTSAVTAYEVVAVLNANATFQALFTASVNLDNKGHTYPVIKALRAREKFKSYVSNGNAELALRFNKKAGVAEFPTYFDRHAISSKASFPDSVGMLVKLDLTSTRDQQIVDEAGLSYAVGLSSGSATVTIVNTGPFNVGDSIEVYNGTTSAAKTISSITLGTSITLNSTWGGSTGAGHVAIIHADYQLLRGRSGLFEFQKWSYDGNSPPRPTTLIEYPAGALVGDLAKKVTYSYTSTNVLPDKVAEVPYTLTSGDLITPP